MFRNRLLAGGVLALVTLLLPTTRAAAQPDQKTVRIPDPRIGDGSRLPDTINSGTYLGSSARGIIVRDVGQQRHVLVDRATQVLVSGGGDASSITRGAPITFTGVFDSSRSVLTTDAIEVFQVATKRPTVTGNNWLHNRSNETIDRHVVVNDMNQIVSEGARINGRVLSVNPLVVSVGRQRFTVQLGDAARVTMTCLVDDFSLCSEGDRVYVSFRTVRSNDSQIASLVRVTRTAPFSAVPSSEPEGRGRGAAKR